MSNKLREALTRGAKREAWGNAEQEVRRVARLAGHAVPSPVLSDIFKKWLTLFHSPSVDCKMIIVSALKGRLENT